MMNRFGVDHSYFSDKIESVRRSLWDYTPSELAREFARMSKTADGAVLLEPEFQPAKIEPTACEWRLDDWEHGIWVSSCNGDLSYSFVDGGPVENGHKFCHSCGRPLVVIGDKDGS